MDALQQIPLDKIKPSPLNYRKTVDGIEELAADIKLHGLISPILVRPSGPVFEIVCGERRYRAVKHLGAPTIAATVAVLNDPEVAERQLAENMQRADVDPIEEAEGMERLLTRTDKTYTVETVATIVGKSLGFVYARLRLTTLVPDARKALRAGTLTFPEALAVARLSTAVQANALELIDDYRDQGEHLTKKTLKEIFEQHFFYQLGGARFPMGDDKLLSGVSSCKACPHRSGNQPHLFGDLSSKETCTKPECFNAKTQANWERQVAEAKGAGISIMPADRAKKLFSNGGSLPYGDWLDLDAENTTSSNRTSWRKLLGKKLPPITLAQDGTGAARQLIRREDAFKILDELKPGSLPASTATSTVKALEATKVQAKELAKQKADAEAQRKKAILVRDTARRAVAAAVALIEKEGFSDKAWEIWLNACLRGSWHEVIAETCKRRGLDRKAAKSPEDALRALIPMLKPRQKAALAMELCLTRGSVHNYDQTLSNSFEADCVALGVDLADVRKVAKTAMERVIEAKSTSKASSTKGDDRGKKTEKPAKKAAW
jgi:ParB/RepB/Spo0J family partition protein